MSIGDILDKKREENNKDRYKKFGLVFNPFPKSGTANINESSHITEALFPLDEKAANDIEFFIADSLYSDDDSDDYKLIGTITGDYGTGKTQLLLFAKSLIQSQPKKAYVVYINNPGTKLSELIGAIIENIGQEQFKKYLWNQVLEKIKGNAAYKEVLLKFTNSAQSQMFPKSDPFSPMNEANHKLFLEAFIAQINTKQKRIEFNNTLKSIITEIIAEENEKDAVIASYFYDLISEDFGINKTWETLTSGSGKYLDNKVVKLLNAIIEIIKQQGFERFYLLVDEFEDITSGRLTKKEIDNYSHNLRALIDKERRWCLLLAMTSEALQDLKKVSPPLVDRLTDREIKIERLSKAQARQIISNYLNLARESVSSDLTPLSVEAIDYINEISGELPRLLLRRAHFLLERAVEDIPQGGLITREYVEKHLEV